MKKIVILSITIVVLLVFVIFRKPETVTVTEYVAWPETEYTIVYWEPGMDRIKDLPKRTPLSVVLGKGETSGSDLVHEVKLNAGYFYALQVMPAKGYVWKSERMGWGLEFEPGGNKGYISGETFPPGSIKNLHINRREASK